MGIWEVPPFPEVAAWGGERGGKLSWALLGGWLCGGGAKCPKASEAEAASQRKSELPAAESSCGRQGYLFLCL